MIQTRNLLFVGLGLLAVFAVMGCGDDGGGEEKSENDVNAFASLLAYEDLNGPVVEARLFAFSDYDFSAIPDAANARVEVDGQEIPLVAQNIRLTTGETTTMFKASSQQGAALTYVPGATYTFRFDVARFNQNATRELVVVAPDAASQVDFSQDNPSAAQALEVVTDDYDAGILTAAQAGRATFASFPVKESDLDTVQTLAEADATLRSYGRQIVTLPEESFASAGSYDVTYFGLNVGEARVGLGELSTVVAGEATHARVEVR